MTREKFVVEGLGGAKTLRGAVAVRGAKNAALKCLAASVLFEDTLVCTNVPDIEDVRRMGELLQVAGAEVTTKDGVVRVSPPDFAQATSGKPNSAEATSGKPSAWNTSLDQTIAKRMRASIVMTGPMLARMGEVSFPYPGGCVLGERPIDLFLAGFTALGAKIVEADDFFTVRAPQGLRGAHIFLPIVSVGATETLMFAAALAHGETILENVAMEPEIVAEAELLNACGAHIEGAGSPTLRITGTGGVPLKANGAVFSIIPDRLEAGSFLILAALAAEDVTVTKCEPKHLQAVTSSLARAGVSLEIGTDTIRVRASEKPYQSVSVRTHEYPGFPTDLQAPMAVFLSQCEGDATILETIYDGRFRYAEDLRRMDADMTVMNPHQVLIRGPRKLERANLESPDIRAGLAYLIAAIIAEGTSSVDNAYLIDRGYEHIEDRLSSLGLHIKRESSN